MSWINHLPPACWSIFWKSNFKQQLGCRFDIMDNISYFFVFWHMQLYMSWCIRSFFGFTFLNILYFFKYSCTNIFHRRSLYTFYTEVYCLTFLRKPLSDPCWIIVNGEIELQCVSPKNMHLKMSFANGGNFVQASCGVFINYLYTAVWLWVLHESVLANLIIDESNTRKHIFCKQPNNRLFTYYTLSKTRSSITRYIFME